MEEEERDQASRSGKVKGTLVTAKMISHWSKALEVGVVSLLYILVSIIVGYLICE
jgi:hypothetical protein